jgi:hypothetical protein
LRTDTIKPMSFARRCRRAGLLLLAPAIFLAVYAVYAPNQALITPDSSGYLTFSDFRSGGYPFFLASLKPLVRDFADYTIAQRLLYAASIVLLGRELLRFFDRPVLAVLAQIALLFNPAVNRYHFAILTESLFLSVSALFLAAALAYLRTGGLAMLAAASAIAGSLVAIRLTGYAFVAALVVLALSRRLPARRELVMRLLAVVVPLVAVLALESVYYGAHHPGPRNSLADTHLLAKLAMMEPPDRGAIGPAMPAAGRELMEAHAASLQRIRQLVSAAPNLSGRCVLGSIYENIVQYGLATELRAILLAHGGRAAVMRAGWEELVRGISGYVQLSSRHLACGCSVPPMRPNARTSTPILRPSDRSRSRRLLSKHSRLPASPRFPVGYGG